MARSDGAILMRRMGVTLAIGLTGLTMLMYALERTSLIVFAEGSGTNPPVRIYLTLFAGFVIVNLCTFFALSQWARYLRFHPETKQLPLWFLVALLLLSGAALLTAMANHAGYLRSLDAVSVDPNGGYIAFQVVFGALLIVSLVLLAVRWSPGYKNRGRASAE
ncbi:hypothetical protein [uncultured Demequina sp.]|uniref:hypothetical protein n=1 Tax=uncultured Demequina sp. TaxID=693499 RepID=UPI0025E04A68|nr:hypothetical protein [uncultured Demequina sp.]